MAVEARRARSRDFGERIIGATTFAAPTDRGPSVLRAERTVPPVVLTGSRSCDCAVRHTNSSHGYRNTASLAPGSEDGIAAWARGRKAEEAAAELRRSGVPAVVVQPAHGLGSDPQLAATGFWLSMERRYVGHHAHAAPVFQFDSVRPALRRPAPLLGEHTDEVLSQVTVA